MSSTLRFTVQKHAARHLHFDLRLEWGGVLKSWAVPKGPSLDPRERRLAVAVEDRRLDYADFEGTIAADLYGTGTVLLWDRGNWLPEGEERDVAVMLAVGELPFCLWGERMRGAWRLSRLRGAGQRNWLLVKRRDGEARDDAVFSPLADDRSVASGRTLAEIGAGKVSRA
jgi:bifunctional non-homologous end joining protein LigD